MGAQSGRVNLIGVCRCLQKRGDVRGLHLSLDRRFVPEVLGRRDSLLVWVTAFWGEFEVVTTGGEHMEAMA